ncbi:hypothetical protein J7E87_22585 [Streptomyces sp. ISL-1]|uniref:DUF6454 family protein n=1 Tax=Streptomyces sp. ISL-1 TaxID=2817657 RepID=UPI001BEBA6C1|nr:DUF6454 family protein [Streptomyces sp. ISL-1]MBT2392140.1 hypothetical protein [Streptomyces sp. ISL-1]
MRSTRVFRVAALVTTVLATAAATVVTTQAVGADRSAHAPLAEAVSHVNRSTQWTLARRIKLDFPTYHPQGFARVGNRLFLSSVEIIEAPVKYPAPVDGYDRTPGKGRGHVFVLDLQGNLIKDIVLGEGHMYHPGGIDADATSLWVPVAEYRPRSHAIVYRIDLRTLTVHEAFRAADHVGGVVPDPTTGRVHGVTWGSREFYVWNGTGKELSHAVNTSHFLDYQDCANADRRTMLCTGITAYKTATGADFELGGVAVLDLDSHAARHEAPIQQWSAAGHVATRNPVHLETDHGTLRMWAAPDDGEERAGTEILVYETTVG